jgi:hypothetical protein
MVIIFQPSFLSDVTAFSSLALLVVILFSHQPVLALETTQYLQPAWPCQRQPGIKTTVLYFGKTMLGRFG